jgi:hypothetical protein
MSSQVLTGGFRAFDSAPPRVQEGPIFSKTALPFLRLAARRSNTAQGSIGRLQKAGSGCTSPEPMLGSPTPARHSCLIRIRKSRHTFTLA